MAIKNTSVVDTTLKYFVKSTGIKDEDNQIMVDAEKLKDGTNKSKVNFGNDGIISLSTDSSVDSYLMVTEFRRNED